MQSAKYNVYISEFFTNNIVSSSVIIISICSTIMFELDFDLVCCLTNKHHQYRKAYAHHEHNLCLALFTFLRGLIEREA